MLRIGKLNERIREMSLQQSKQAWEQFRRTYLTEHAPAGQDRYRAVFQAAINTYRELHDLPPLRIEAVPFDNERVRFLTKQDRDRLIMSYSPDVQSTITILAFHGPSIQTALQMPRRVNNVDKERETIRLNHTKNAVMQFSAMLSVATDHMQESINKLD